MNNEPQAPRDSKPVPAEKPVVRDSLPPGATVPERGKKPGQVGLANEARPGLGTRAVSADPALVPGDLAEDVLAEGAPKATPHGYEEPRPAPREQPSNSRAHEEERSTGMSGQSSGA